MYWHYLYAMETGYFDGKISRGFVSLYTSKVFVWVGVGFFGIFLPIFLYELFGQNFTYVVAYYLIGWLIYPLTITLGAKFLNGFGFKKALQLSSVWGSLFYAVFFFRQRNKLGLPYSTLITYSDAFSALPLAAVPCRLH